MEVKWSAAGGGGPRQRVGSTGWYTLQKNSREISVSCSAVARPQPTRRGNFQEILTCVGKLPEIFRKFPGHLLEILRFFCFKFKLLTS